MDGRENEPTLIGRAAPIIKSTSLADLGSISPVDSRDADPPSVNCRFTFDRRGRNGSRTVRRDAYTFTIPARGAVERSVSVLVMETRVNGATNIAGDRFGSCRRHRDVG